MIKSQVSRAVTFDQLSQVLAHLGFEVRDMPEFIMSRNADADAVITLPREDASATLCPLHLAAARATVAGKGVASPADFDQLLAQARRTHAQTADAAAPKKKAKRLAA